MCFFLIQNMPLHLKPEVMQLLTAPDSHNRQVKLEKEMLKNTIRKKWRHKNEKARKNWGVDVKVGNLYVDTYKGQARILKLMLVKKLKKL